MTLLSISSCPAALLCFTDSKAFSKSSKVRSLYSTFFCTENRKSSNVMCFVSCWPDLVLFIEFLCNATILSYGLSINIYLSRKSVRVKFTFSRNFFHYLPCACHVILTILKYRLTVCLLSFLNQFFKKVFIVLEDLFLLNRFIFWKFNIQLLFLLRQFFQSFAYPWSMEVLYFDLKIL